MLSYCLKCRKYTESKSPMVSNYMVFASKKSKFTKEQEASWLFSSLEIKISLSKILLFGPSLFWRYEMKKIINNFLLAGDKFIPEMCLR